MLAFMVRPDHSGAPRRRPPKRAAPAGSIGHGSAGLRRCAFIWLILTMLPLVSPASTQAQSAVPAASPTTAASGASGDFEGLVEIGDGRRLYIACRGTGSPTVLLEAGYRSPATVWSEDLAQPDNPRTMVLAGVATFARVCLYERPGVAAVLDGELHLSRSDPVPMPRPVEEIVADLHALLAAAEVPGPYVLVGHSLGGLMVRLYQATYPDQVVGMVLVDAFPERLATILTPAEWADFLAVNAIMPPAMAGYADYETIDFAAASASMAAAAAAHPFPPMPLFVLARGKPMGLTEEVLGFPPETLEAAWRAAEEELATLSPSARFMVAPNSEHDIQLDEPEVVIRAIARVVTAAREPGAYLPASPVPE